MDTRFEKTERAYTGVELRPHFLLETMGLKGSALGAFVGPCKVATEHLVDWEDRLAQDRIEARQMVHFIGEFFGIGLREGVVLQRLFMSQLCEQLHERVPTLWREGDDLYFAPGGGRGPEARKLSVSIVTASPVSVLLHTGINIDPSGAPVPAIGLAEMKVDVDTFVARALERFASEFDSLQWACAKVRPVM